MKKITLALAMVLLFCTSTWAQSQKLFRIDYRVLAESGSIDESSDAGALFTAWVNNEYLRVDNAALNGVVYVTHKKDNYSFALAPASEEYVSTADASEDEEEEAMAWELVSGQQKKIAGYNCKLAKINLDYGAEEGQQTTVEVWYTEEIPNLYWGEFHFFKQLKGAVLSFHVNGYGLIATKVETETLDNSFFEIPENYTEMTEETGLEESDGQLAEDRFLYSDDSGAFFGMKDESDNIITEPLYTYIGIFNADNVSIAISKDDKYGAIDKNGKILVPLQYDYLSYDETTKQYLYGKNEKYGLLNKDGKIAVPAKYDMISFFHQGMATITVGEKSGLIDQNQNIIIPTVYPVIFEYNKDNFTTVENEEYVLYSIAHKRKIAGGFDFLSLSSDNNLILAQKDGKYGFIDANGKTVIPFKFTYANTFSDNMAAVAEDTEAVEIYYINSKGERIDFAEN